MSGIKFVTYPGSPNPFDWGGSFGVGTDTTKFTDGGVFDTTTYESTSVPGTLLGCYDFGTPTAIDGIKAYYLVGSGHTVLLHYSNDFSTWTQIVITPDLYPFVSQTWAAITARYWLLEVASSGTAALFDYRLYSAGVQQLPPAPPATSLREVHIFSTGTLYADVEGTPVELALLQNVAMTIKGAEKRLYDCPIRSVYPIDVAFCEGQALMQAETASISPSGIVKLLGGSLSGTSVLQLLTLSKTLLKMPFSLTLTLQDTTGKQHVWTLNNVYCPDLKLPVKAADFLMPDFNLIGLPDVGGIVATVTMTQ